MADTVSDSASDALAFTPPQPPPRAGRGEILSETSTMPGSSFSPPARRTCPGAIFGPNTVCSACYADNRHRYRWRAVQEAQARRLAWTLDSLSSGRFTAVVTDRIASRAEPHFRLHDAGDFFSPPYVEAWREIARTLPAVSFWAPTRSWATGGQCRPYHDPLLISLRHLATLPNVTVRPSALSFDEPPPRISGLASGTTVTMDRTRATCPKTLTIPSACGDCRRCWEEPLVSVTYLRH